MSSFCRPTDLVAAKQQEGTTSFGSEARDLRRYFRDRVVRVLKRIFVGLVSAGRVDC